jgi:hypothetical protein
VETALWAAALLLAIIELGAGTEKLITPYEKFRVKRPWADGVDPRAVRVLGTLEVLGAIGLIVPAAIGIAPILVPLAAACLAVLMVGALAVEARRHPSLTTLALPAVTLILAVVVTVGRSGAYPL